MTNELDNLAEIENEGLQNSNLNLSNIYSVRVGGFGIDSNLKTYLTTLNVEELERDVRFYETLSNDKDWPISQIIQREVEPDRVNSITQKYLLGKGRIVKYFPPIIVALLPRDNNGNFAKKFAYQPNQTDEHKELIFEKSKYRTNAKFKKILLEKPNDSMVDGVYLYNTSPVFEHNILCWDQSKFFAVVIDGQHRLEALIKGKNDEQTFKSALQDVILLDVSPLIHLNQNLTPVEVLRTVFIDINTNAKSVGLVRRILMDDKDLASLCVQSLVESVNKDGSSKENGTYVPSVLIDWDGTSLKHELPHITGILTLYQIISDELATDRLVTIDDHRNHKKIQYFMELLNNYFFVDQLIKTKAENSDISSLETSFKAYLSEKEINRASFSELLQENTLDTILFNYDYRVLELAQHTFEELYLRSLVKIYGDFKPYLEATEVLQGLNAFDSESTLYKALLKSKIKIAANANLRDTYLDAKRQLNEKVNEKYFLFYSVVGQKGLFKVFFEKIFSDFKYGIKEEFILNHQQEFIRQINNSIEILNKGNIFLFGKAVVDITDYLDGRLEEYHSIASSFWEGILYEDGKIVYNSQGVRAFADVLKFVNECIAKGGDKKDNNSLTGFAIRFSIQRTKRLLKKRFGNKSDAEIESIANSILQYKKKFVIENINKILSTD